MQCSHATITQLWNSLGHRLGLAGARTHIRGWVAHFQSVCRSLYSQLFVSAISTLSLRPHSHSGHR